MIDISHVLINDKKEILINFFFFRHFFNFIAVRIIKGDGMKASFIFPIIFSILLGAFFGKLLFSQYETKEVLYEENNVVYALQQGVYQTLDSLEAGSSKITNKVTVLENDRYYVYVGMTKDLDNVKKIQELYKQQGYELYAKKIDIANYEFINTLEQYDILLKNAKKKEEIDAVLKVILASYEETVLNS